MYGGSLGSPVNGGAFSSGGSFSGGGNPRASAFARAFDVEEQAPGPIRQVRGRRDGPYELLVEADADYNGFPRYSQYDWDEPDWEHDQFEGPQTVGSAIFVRNLPPGVEGQQLKHLFEEAGQIANIQVDQGPLPTATIGYVRQGVAFDAAEMFHGRWLLGQELKAAFTPNGRFMPDSDSHMCFYPIRADVIIGVQDGWVDWGRPGKGAGKGKKGRVKGGTYSPGKGSAPAGGLILQLYAQNKSVGEVGERVSMRLTICALCRDSYQLSGKGPGFEKEQVRRIDLDDVEVFMSLQDAFVLEHHSLTNKVYEEVTLLDWKHSLVCPRELLEKPGGRREQVVSIVKQDHRYYRDLYILLAREGDREAGYIMYQVHKGKRKDAAPSAYVEVKQIFVEMELRKRGLGKLLVDGMMQAVEGQACQKIRLSVLDLNDEATNWYRKQGFVMIGLVWEYIGPKEKSLLVAYQAL
ncbi:unnamed protein product [Symbiodinium natans]|uniref:N-acetyltransferase domain-containing protein n=1 Tax=Symbiodinium natans TaxID=878477 RepID=A0A812TLR4_9DINO|nr:unnamed protein product [Symbiodinium natans]